MISTARYLTTADIVNALGVTRQTVQSYIKQGKLKAVKVGRYWYIKPEDFEQMMQGDEANEKSEREDRETDS